MARSLMNAVSEDVLQEQCVDWLTYQRNMGVLRFFAVPNGGSRNAREAANMKRRGVVAGVQDLVILLPSREYTGIRAPASKPRVLFCELKRPSHNGKLKGDQLDWQEWMVASGFHHHVIRSLEEIQALVKTHGAAS